MRRQDIIRQTGISQTTFTTYRRLGIIIIDSRKNEGQTEYDPASVERAKVARRLTGLAFRLEDIKVLLDRTDLSVVTSKIESLPLMEFQKWFKDQVS